MNESTFEQVIASYQRCREHGEFFDSFYRRFIAKSPELPAMFAATDFKRQTRMLKQSLFEMFSFFRGIDDAATEIAKLAKRHREMEITPRHYGLWLDALVESVAASDPQFDENLEDLWRTAMKPGLDAMQTENDDIE